MLTSASENGVSAALWRRLRGSETALALAVGVFVALTTAVSWDAPPALRGVPAIGWALIVVASAALWLRRRFPVTVAVVTFVACIVYYPLIEVDGAIIVTFVVALYTLSSLGRVRAAVAVGLVASAGTAYGELSTSAEPLGDAGLFLIVGWFVAAVAGGAVIQSRQAYLQETEQRARALERSRDEALRRRATEERLRIARELHDVLGHHISLINVQAGAALHRLDRDPGQAGDALTAITSTSREALRELRATLGVLRQVDEEAPTAPTAGLSRLSDLVEGPAATGVDVQIQSVGEVRLLSAAVDFAAYRIVQEALTNVTRHADARTVVVRITYGAGDVTVEVRDDGRDGGQGGGSSVGGGLRGMRERAAALGGSLTAGPRADGGFEVRAWLPCEGDA